MCSNRNDIFCVVASLQNELKASLLCRGVFCSAVCDVLLIEVDGKISLYFEALLSTKLEGIQPPAPEHVLWNVSDRTSILCFRVSQVETTHSSMLCSPTVSDFFYPLPCSPPASS